MPKDAETVASFPAYAELTQTQGWNIDSNRPVAADSETFGTERYTDGPLLGVGGMGKVLLAHDARVGREVAVKQLHGDRELAPEERARFLREARVQGQLEHPSIVPVYDIEQRADGTTFFTMRRVLGRTLQAIIEDLRDGRIEARGRYSQRELLQAFATVCLAVDYAHSRGVIHRDIKPANIMLGDFGEVYVLDWGLARLLEETTRPSDGPVERLSRTGAAMGTPLYMAPEQMSSPDVGATADVFALGAVLFELLTYVRLRTAATLYAPAEARPSVRAPDRAIAPELEAICVKATQTDEADRYPTARALQEAVARYLEGDRELAHRRELAAHHASAAQDALARAADPRADFEAERGTAMRELQRALALEPTNREHVVALTQVMATPPRETPAPVRQEMLEAEQDVVRSGARYSIAASASWFLFLPPVLAIGILDWSLAGLVMVPITIAIGLLFISLRWKLIPYWAQLVVFGGTVLGAAATSTMFGPFGMVPPLVASLTIVMQSHPQRVMRIAAILMGALALTVPTLLELAGITHAYDFSGGAMAILPRMHALPRTPSLLLLIAATLATMVVPCMFIGRLRAMITDLQKQLLVRAWHFRRLGDELVG